jgi:hypothetical protein
MSVLWRRAVELLSQNAFGELKIEQAVRDFTEFLESEEGLEARKLLKGSGLPVVFGETEATSSEQGSSGERCQFFWNNSGLMMRRASFSSGAPSDWSPAEGVSIEQAILVAISYNKLQPEEFMPWFLKQIDDIARQVILANRPKPAIVELVELWLARLFPEKK